MASSTWLAQPGRRSLLWGSGALCWSWHSNHKVAAQRALVLTVCQMGNRVSRHFCGAAPQLKSCLSLPTRKKRTSKNSSSMLIPASASGNINHSTRLLHPSWVRGTVPRSANSCQIRIRNTRNSPVHQQVLQLHLQRTSSLTTFTASTVPRF